MKTFAEVAETPESRAQYDTLSPQAQALADDFVAFLDDLSPTGQRMALAGLRLLLGAKGEPPLAELALAAEHFDAESGPDRPSGEDVVLGTIDGCAVTGGYTNEGKLYEATMTWNGLKIGTDGTDFVNCDVGEGLGCMGDMHLWEWGKVKELASTDVMEQLIALARAKVQRPA